MNDFLDAHTISYEDARKWYVKRLKGSMSESSVFPEEMPEVLRKSSYSPYQLLVLGLAIELAACGFGHIGLWERAKLIGSELNDFLDVDEHWVMSYDLRPGIRIQIKCQVVQELMREIERLGSLTN